MLPLLIVASGSGVIEEYSKAQVLCKDYDVMAVNFGVMVTKRINHLVSLHHDWMKLFSDIVVIANKQPRESFITYSRRPKLDHVDKVTKWTNEGTQKCGSSSLFAVDMAIREGYEKIILCGVPLDGKGHFYDSVKHDLEFMFSPVWRTYPFKDKVRSMSGLTQEILGEPTKEWLDA